MQAKAKEKNSDFTMSVTLNANRLTIIKTYVATCGRAVQGIVPEWTK